MKGFAHRPIISVVPRAIPTSPLRLSVTSALSLKVPIHLYPLITLIPLNPSTMPPLGPSLLPTSGLSLFYPIVSCSLTTLTSSAISNAKSVSNVRFTIDSCSCISSVAHLSSEFHSEQCSDFDSRIWFEFDDCSCLSSVDHFTLECDDYWSSNSDETSALRLLAAVLHRPLTTLAPSALLTKAPSLMTIIHALCLTTIIYHRLLTHLLPNGMLILASDSDPMLNLIPSPMAAFCPMAMAAQVQWPQ